MKKKINLIFLLLIPILFFYACVKDTDFNQTDDIEVTPVLELDFLFFNLEAENFLDINTGEYNLFVSDTTDYTFLNDEFTADNLLKANFLFKTTNSLPVSFTSQIQFLNSNNEIFYEILFNSDSGTINNPTLNEFTQTIEGSQITELTQADRVIVSITASANVDNLEGLFNFQSKTTYFLKVGL